MIRGRLLAEQDEALMFVFFLPFSVELLFVKSSSGQLIDWNTNSLANWRMLVLSDCYVNSGLLMNVQSNLFFFLCLSHMQGLIQITFRFARDSRWSETGDRYIVKLFRDYVFHQVDEMGNPLLDLSHVLTCLNKVMFRSFFRRYKILHCIRLMQVQMSGSCSLQEMSRVVLS
jgi:Pan3 Pseudokinase domain